MASKKNVFLSGIMCLFASASFAQVQTGYDVKDSSLIPPPGNLNTMNF